MRRCTPRSARSERTPLHRRCPCLRAGVGGGYPLARTSQQINLSPVDCMRANGRLKCYVAPDSVPSTFCEFCVEMLA